MSSPLPTPDPSASPVAGLLSEANAAYITELLAQAYPDGVPEYLFAASDDRSYKLHKAAPAYIADLLADRAAYRQQVAQELAGLQEAFNGQVYPPTPYWRGVNETRRRVLEKIDALITRLGLSLSPLPQPGEQEEIITP